MRSRSRSRKRKRSRTRRLTKNLKVMRYTEHKGGDYSKFVGWLASEKKDGWQVLFDSKRMVSKTQKRKFTPPFEHKTKFPMAGELVVRGRQAPAVASLLRPDSKLWDRATVSVFDALIPGKFSERTKKLKKEVKRMCKGKRRCPIKYLRQTRVKSQKHLRSMLSSVTKRKGEGLVVTDPGSLYKPGLSRHRAKIKPRHDAEGSVVSKKINSNGLLKSLLLKAHGRHRFSNFSLGGGFTHSQRKNHHKLFPKGTIIKFTYREMTANNRPKEASFKHIRLD